MVGQSLGYIDKKVRKKIMTIGTALFLVDTIVILSLLLKRRK
jgi:hypothetical protein